MPANRSAQACTIVDTAFCTCRRSPFRKRANIRCVVRHAVIILQTSPGALRR